MRNIHPQNGSFSPENMRTIKFLMKPVESVGCEGRHKESLAEILSVCFWVHFYSRSLDLQRNTRLHHPEGILQTETRVRSNTLWKFFRGAVGLEKSLGFLCRARALRLGGDEESSEGHSNDRAEMEGSEMAPLKLRCCSAQAQEKGACNHACAEEHFNFICHHKSSNHVANSAGACPPSFPALPSQHSALGSQKSLSVFEGVSPPLDFQKGTNFGFQFQTCQGPPEIHKCQVKNEALRIIIGRKMGADSQIESYTDVPKLDLDGRNRFLLSTFLLKINHLACPSIYQKGEIFYIQQHKVCLHVFLLLWKV